MEPFCSSLLEMLASLLSVRNLLVGGSGEASAGWW